ncbi:pyridoxamine 5'-phosphate oxidase [Alteriqipengyuania lutimaris]|uniref:Pyridoxine/pyridoxamine 5'-phosphate oxidase n=1 Tax=Alteriqipengyuania lutimaris TaxID=1538146 RepID=A0A395LPY4_9SPHN|nr:pyridoxamine 5'-phosphate oxidase [Alteriqipengyuania lutimaris]MBB3034327.1 pyridoxamine 5'-phosphate oxidase [Alteriqipengyuania lutimaris]RDS76770.1 pyridoxamine 5'-phosphate oxidase [Alteriqipengyuania lutimaris]
MKPDQPTADASALPTTDPLGLFEEWMLEARESEPNDSNAMALATATPEGRPSVRMVLLKDHRDGGFTFYTNAQSRKGEEIRANMHAALLFHWKSLRRQIRIEGPLRQVSDATADAYFHSRSRASQLGAVASAQSRPLDDRALFVERYEAAEQRFAGGEVERPAHWTGFTLDAQRIEFWLDRENRLHDRRLFVRDGEGPGAGWTSSLLYP